jgi:hypothetical protein
MQARSSTNGTHAELHLESEGISAYRAASPHRSVQKVALMPRYSGTRSWCSSARTAKAAGSPLGGVDRGAALTAVGTERLLEQVERLQERLVDVSSVGFAERTFSHRDLDVPGTEGRTGVVGDYVEHGSCLLIDLPRRRRRRRGCPTFAGTATSATRLK